LAWRAVLVRVDFNEPGNYSRLRKMCALFSRSLIPTSTAPRTHEAPKSRCRPPRPPIYGLVRQIPALLFSAIGCRKVTQTNFLREDSRCVEEAAFRKLTFLRAPTRHQNRWDSALANLQKANDLDPRNGEVAYWFQQTYFYMRRYHEEEQLIKKCAASGTFEGPWIQNWLAEI